MEKLPIDDVLDLVKLGCQIGVDIVESFTDDGKITFTDIPKFVDSLALIPEAIIGIENVIPQIKDIDEQEVINIKNVVFETVSGIDNLDVKWIEIAQEALNIAVGLVKIYLAMKGKK